MNSRLERKISLGPPIAKQHEAMLSILKRSLQKRLNEPCACEKNEGYVCTRCVKVQELQSEINRYDTQRAS